MPQLGETVTEGTITRWFKQVGESVDLDEPLFEVSTDKVDSEVPAPAGGVITEILVAEGDTVAVGVRLAVIGGAQAPASQPPDAAPAAVAPIPVPTAPVPAAPVPAAPVPTAVAAVAIPVPLAPTPAPTPAVPTPVAGTAPANTAVPLVSGVVASPLVRGLISEYGLDGASIVGTGLGGRITRNDVLAVARMRGAGAPASVPGAPASAASAPQLSSSGTQNPEPQNPERASVATSGGDLVVPFDNIRRRTAEHMVRSKATSAHVYTSIEVDFERIERVRRAAGAAFKAEEGFSLTYLPFVCRALSDVLHDYPNVNASVDGDSLVVHREVHLGIAVDLDFHGLVAPVVRAVDGKRLRLIAREIRDLAARAKTKQLRPDEVMGGTFTITNMGPFGTAMTLPIINQPQVAILATDGVHKKPVVVLGPDGDDTIAIHHMGVLALAWDHRAFDGAYAGSFLHDIKTVLETHDWNSELN